MRKLSVLAALLAPILLTPVRAFAADPALVEKVEAMLSSNEKSILAALLTHPDLSAQFDNDAALALKDPKNLHPFLGVWRAKFESYAESDANHPTPDLDAQYSRYTDLMTSDMFAFLERSLKLMSEDQRNDVIGYLKAIDETLQSDGHLSKWNLTKTYVSGITEEYRKQLTAYVATPLAQEAKRELSANAAALAAIHKADDVARETASKPAAPPASEVAKTPANKPPTPVSGVSTNKPEPATTDAGSVAVNKPGNGALDQAQRTADAGANGGRVIDGGGASRPTDAVAVPSGSGGAHPQLPPSTPGSRSNMTVSGPVPSPSAGSRADSLLGMQTKPGHPPAALRKLKMAGTLLGGILGALIGFFVGGPVGAIVGAAIGVGLGHVAAGLITKRLLK
ncbi:MAG: hypothetical protein ACHQ2Z_10165 [Elusimicrobiota bacterium]